jgi:hypothetical protein
MNDFKTGSSNPALGRRDFMKLGIGAGTMAAAGLSARATSAQVNGTNGWSLQSSGPPESIDMHSHWVPEAYARAMADMYGRGGIVPLMETLETRIERMDRTGVKMLVLTLSGGQPWRLDVPGRGGTPGESVQRRRDQGAPGFPRPLCRFG